MVSRSFVIGLCTAGLLASSCASTARDALVEIYENEVEASSVDESCVIDDKTFAVASQAYVAENGTTPQSTSDLVPDWLREEPDAWEFDASSPTSFSPLAGGRCDGFDADRTSPSSVGQNAVDRIDDAGGVTCATDKRQIETGLELHFALTGAEAETIEDLLEIGVDGDPERWTLEPSTDPAIATPTVVAVVGSVCDS